MASVNEEVNFDVNFNDSEVAESVNRLKSQINQLKKEVDALREAYRNIFSSGDYSGLRSANNQLSSLRDRASELRNEISRSASAGIDTSDMQSELSDVENGIRRISEESSNNIKKGLVNGFKTAMTKINTIATSVGKNLYKTAVSLVRNWGNVLSRTFKSVVSGWKKVLSGIFSSKDNGYLSSQLKSLMGYASLAGLIALGKEAVELSSSLFEVQNVIDNVFPEATETINDFCENAAGKFGLTTLEAKKMIGVFGGMLSASNITGEAQREMSKNLTALTGDLASFYNMSVSDVYDKLQSGLQGNVAAMRSFGVSMTVANLDAYALSQGLTTTYSEMDQASKTTLRYNYMLQQLSVAQGDFTRTSGSWANQIRTLSSNFKQLISILGGGIIKALYPAITVLNQIVSAAINAANALARIFGFSPIDLSSMFGAGAEMPDLGDYSSGLEDVADATGDVADATAKANENLQTFDKLNNVQTPTSGGGGGGAGGAAGGVGGILDFDSYYDKVGEPQQAISKRVQAILDVLKDFARDIASVDYSQFTYSWKKMINSLDPLISDLGDGIIWVWKKVLFPFYKWGIEAGAPAVFDVISESLKALHEIILAVAPEIDSFWDTTLAPFFSNKGDAFVSLMKKWKISLREWTEGLKTSDDKLKYLGDTISTLKEKLYDWIDDEGITSRLDSIGDHFKGIFNNLVSADAREQAKSLLRTFTKLNLIAFDNILKVVEYLTGNTKVTSFVEFLVDEFGDLADYTFDAIIDIIDYIAGSDDAREVITNIKEAIKNIIDWVVEHKDTIISLLEKASEILLFLSEHIDEVLIALISIKGINAFSSLIIGASDLLSALGLAEGGVKSLSGSLSALAVPAAGIAAVIDGVSYIGTEAYKYTKELNDAQEEFNNTYTKSADVIDNLANSQEHLFDADDYITYGLNVKAASDAFNNLDDSMKTLIATNGKMSVSRENFVFLGEARDSALEYEKALRDAGYANDDLLDKLHELATKDVGWGKGSGAQLKQDIVEVMREISESVSTEAASLRNMTEDEFNDIYANLTDTAYQAGTDAIKGYSDSFTDNLNYFDVATGQMYNRLEQTYSEITDMSEISGHESIVGYIEGVNGEKEFLVTETGNIIDTVTGVVMKMPEDWRDLAKSSIDNMALEFNSDGTVKDAARGLMQNASDNAKSVAESGALATSNAFLKTASSKINSDSSIKKSVTSNIKGANSAATTEGSNGGSSVAEAFTSVASNKLNDDISILNAEKGAISSASEAARDEASSQGDYTGYEIIQGISGGINNNSWSLWDTMKSLGSRLLSTLKETLGIHSPSRAFADLAKFIPTGVSKGVSDNAEYAYNSVNDLANGMLKAFEDTDLDMSSIIDSSKFSDKYKDILYETDIFTKDMKSKYGDLSAFDMQANMIVSPSVKKAELAANVAQSSTTSRLAEGVSALYNRVSSSAASSGANQLVCNLILSGEKMATFVIDTINGNVVQTGNF